MALDTDINGSGIDGYITSVRGTNTFFVRETVINDADLVDWESAKTAGASLNGLQTVNFFPIAVAGNDAGLTTATYTATVNIDGTDEAVSVDVTTADTFTTVLGLINADLTLGAITIVGGNLVVTATSTGNESYVSITDVDLFSGMAGYLNVADAVDGGVGSALALETLDNGANAYTAYAPAIEGYNTSANATVIKTSYVVADLNATFSDTEVEAELGAIKVKLDALQALMLEQLNEG